MKITKQGAVRINDYIVVYQNEDVACLSLDLQSQYVNLNSVGTGEQIENEISYPVLSFNADDHTLHLDGTQPRDSTTELCFDEFPWFDFFCVDGPYQYTMLVVLIRKHKVIH